MSHRKAKFFASDKFYNSANINLSEVEFLNNWNHEDEPECLKYNFGIFETKKGDYVKRGR